MRKVVQLFVAFFIVSITSTSANALNVKLPNGDKMDVKDIPGFNVGRALGMVQKGMNGGKNIYFSTPYYCPRFLTYGSQCTDKLNKKYNWSDHVDGGCRCEMAIDSSRNLLFPLDVLHTANKFGPLTMRLDQNGITTFIRGMIQYEDDLPTNQSVRLLNAKGEEVCNGKVDFSKSDNKGFDLSCLGDSFQAKGPISPKGMKAGLGIETLGKASLANGDAFTFATGKMAEDVRDDHQDLFEQMKMP